MNIIMRNYYRCMIHIARIKNSENLTFCKITTEEYEEEENRLNELEQKIKGA